MRCLGGFCGYRNIQMLSSYIVGAHVEGAEVLDNRIPSIFRIQDYIENAWDMGINASGRVETGGIKGTRKYIGTPEVRSLTQIGILISFLPYSSHVLITNLSHDRPKPCLSASRYRTSVFFNTLASMVPMSSYPQYANHRGLHRCEAEGFKSHKPGAAEAALFASVLQYFESAPFNPTDKIRCTNLPPIYFQHRGHSLTIVGLEKRASGSLKLLVFDPMFHDPEGVLRLAGRVGRHGSTKEDKNSKTRNAIMHRSPDSALKLYRRGNNYLRKYHEFELLRYVFIFAPSVPSLTRPLGFLFVMYFVCRIQNQAGVLVATPYMSSITITSNALGSRALDSPVDQRPTSKPSSGNSLT